MMQFLAVSKGLLAGGGSTGGESRGGAAEVRPELSAAARAGSSMSGPRPVLRRKAVGFIQERRSALMRFWVCGVSGQCRLSTSLWRNKVSSSTKRTKGGAALEEGL